MADTVKLALYGPQISTFVRCCTTVAHEAGISWQLHATGTGTKESAAHHPFLRTPAAYIDGLHFYETLAITSYIDSQYNQRRLQPMAPEAGARCLQWVGIMSNYVFPIIEERLVLPRLVAPLMERQADENLIAEALPNIAYHMQVVDQRLLEVPFHAGTEVSLADIFMYCVIESAAMTPEGSHFLEDLNHKLLLFTESERFLLLFRQWFSAPAARDAPAHVDVLGRRYPHRATAHIHQNSTTPLIDIRTHLCTTTRAHGGTAI